jgi:hypothetical protein
MMSETKCKRCHDSGWVKTASGCYAVCRAHGCVAHAEAAELKYEHIPFAPAGKRTVINGEIAGYANLMRFRNPAGTFDYGEYLGTQKFDTAAEAQAAGERLPNHAGVVALVKINRAKETNMSNQKPLDLDPSKPCQTEPGGLAAKRWSGFPRVVNAPEPDPLEQLDWEKIKHAVDTKLRAAYPGGGFFPPRTMIEVCYRVVAAKLEELKQAKEQTK